MLDGSSRSEGPRDNSIQYILGRLDGKMDLVLKSVTNHDKRLAAVEKRQWWISGASAVVGVLLTKVTPLATILGFH